MCYSLCWTLKHVGGWIALPTSPFTREPRCSGSTQLDDSPPPKNLAGTQAKHDSDVWARESLPLPRFHPSISSSCQLKAAGINWTIRSVSDKELLSSNKKKKKLRLALKHFTAPPVASCTFIDCRLMLGGQPWAGMRCLPGPVVWGNTDEGVPFSTLSKCGWEEA